MNKPFCLNCLGVFTCPTGSCTEVIPTNAVERWAIKNSKKASAEEIIAAAVIQSFAKDFDDWVATDFSNPDRAYDRDDGCGTLKNKKKNVLIKRFAQSKFNPHGPNQHRFTGQLYINDIEISVVMSKLVIKHWEKVFVQVLKLKTVAEKAKNEMDVSEKAWNLAENLLGMERTSSGALVPKETSK